MNSQIGALSHDMMVHDMMGKAGKFSNYFFINLNCEQWLKDVFSDKSDAALD